MIPIYKPYLPKCSLKYAHEAIDSTWISSNGKFLEMATDALRERLNSKYVQLVNNGTSATHLVAKSLLYKHPSIKKIIVPNNVYVAAWNSFLFDNEFSLEFKEPDISTWNVKFDKNENIDSDTAVCFVHNLGNIVNVPKFMRENPGVVCVEDNCEGLFGEYEGHKSGTKSLASSLSFFGNKTITSGEGGAFVTQDEDVYQYIKSIQGQGQKANARYVHEHLGYNYRMTNVQAALLLGQLEVASEIIEMKAELFDFYRSKFSSIENISTQQIEEGTSHSNWMFAIRIHGSQGYENVSKYLYKMGIETRPMFYPASVHDHIEAIANKSEEKIAKTLNSECIMIPSYPELKRGDASYIVECIKNLSKDIARIL